MLKYKLANQVTDEVIKVVTEANRKYLSVHRPPTVQEKLWAEDLNNLNLAQGGSTTFSRLKMHFKSVQLLQMYSIFAFCPNPPQRLVTAKLTQ